MHKIATALAIALMMSLWAQAVPANSVPDDFVFVAGGDMIGPYRTLKGIDDPGFRQLAALFQKADLGFANQEGAIFDLATLADIPRRKMAAVIPCRQRLLLATFGTWESPWSRRPTIMQLIGAQKDWSRP